MNISIITTWQWEGLPSHSWTGGKWLRQTCQLWARETDWLLVGNDWQGSQERRGLIPPPSQEAAAQFFDQYWLNISREEPILIAHHMRKHYFSSITWESMLDQAKYFVQNRMYFGLRFSSEWFNKSLSAGKELICIAADSLFSVFASYHFLPLDLKTFSRVWCLYPPPSQPGGVIPVLKNTKTSNSLYLICVIGYDQENHQGWSKTTVQVEISKKSK